MRCLAKRVVMLVVLAFVFNLLLFVKSTMALDANAIYKKALLNALPECYSNAYMVDSLTNVTDFPSFFTKDGKGGVSFSGDTIVIPNNNLGNTLSGNARLSCYALFKGVDWHSKHADGLFTIFGKGNYNGNAKDLGYEEIRDSESGTDKCIYFEYQFVEVNGSITHDSDRVCFALDKDDHFKEIDGTVRPSYTHVVYGKGEKLIGGFLNYNSIISSGFTFGITTHVTTYPMGTGTSGPGQFIENCRATSDLTFYDLLNCVKKYDDYDITVDYNGNPTPVTVLRFDEYKNESGEGSSVLSGNWWKGGDPDKIEQPERIKNASLAALRYFTDGSVSSFEENAFKPQEKYDLMKYYVELELTNHPSELGISSENCYNDIGELGEGNYGVLQNGQWCEIIGVERITDTFNIVSSENDRLLKNVTFSELLTEMMATDLSQINVEESDVNKTGLVENPGESEEPTCLNTGAAGSLGWIICPILSGLSSAANAAYEDFIEPALQVSPKLFTDFGGDTWQAWSIFQGFANIAFIILFLVVIFSQLTGVGIDNYGIKKILPKLIIAAVLINLSYIICVALIDVSNIIGNALQSLFDALSQPLGIQPNADINLTESGIESIGATGLTGLALLGIVVVNIWAVVADGGGVEALVLALLVAAIGVVMAIFSLFLILAAREAAIVVLTIISPLAFACMILPNTKKLFEKWVGAGKALLMLYPICGLLVGGGNYVSKLLLSSGMATQGFSAAFMAMVIGAVPIFFIPTLTKSSLQALGNIGAKISGLGKTFGGKLQGNLDKSWKGSQGYKERTQMRADAMAGKRAEKVKAKLRGRTDLTEKELEQLRRAEDTLSTRTNRKEENRMYSDPIHREAYEINQQKKREREQIAAYETLINHKTRNGEDKDELNNLYKSYLGSNNKMGAVAATRIAGRQKHSANDFFEDNIKNENLSNYSEDQKAVFESVMKEIATGDNSGNYKSSSPITFQYALDYNSHAGGVGGYDEWKNNGKNIHNALHNFVTNSSQLMGMSGTAHKELEALMRDNKVDKNDVEAIVKLANDTIDNKAQIKDWDITKEGYVGDYTVIKMSDDAVFELATDPDIDMKDLRREAAEREVIHRGLDK